MASEIKVDTISEKTSAGGVTIDGLLIKDGNISGDVALAGTTPTFTIGDAGAEDAALLFDGNAQDFHIGLDDSSDDLVIGVGSTLGTTTAIAIDENTNTTFSGTVTVGVNDTGKDVKFFGATAGSYWLWDESADGVVQIGTLTVGVNDAGHDVKFFGDAASAYMLWDTSADDLILAGGAGLIVPDGQFTLGSTAVSATAAELNLLDGGTSVGSSITIADADGFVVNDGGTMKTIPATDIPTYVGGGITEIDQWRLTSSLQIGTSETAITANLERVDAPKTHTGNLGTGMSESSGVFTFPSTGWWEVSFNVKFDLASGGDDRNVTMRINVTDDNSGYKYVGYQSESIHNETNSSSHAHIYHSVVLDIESTTNDKVKFAISSINGAAAAQGQTGYSRTYMKFIKLADT